MGEGADGRGAHADTDPTDFRAFAAARMAPLRRLGYLICGDWHLAEDAVANVLSKLYVSWHDLGHVRNREAYARTMLVRAIVAERRRPWRREAPVHELPAVPVDALTGTVDDHLVLQQALDRMPTRRRAVLVLRFYQGLSVEETAAAMGCSAGTVKSQTARALAALRDLLPADYQLLDGGGR